MGSERWTFEEQMLDMVTDAEVHIAGRRCSGSVATPESLREVLERWASTGEHGDPARRRPAAVTSPSSSR